MHRLDLDVKFAQPPHLLRIAGFQGLQFAQQALSAFRKFGFQLVIVATVQNATTIQPYIDSVVMVSKTEATGRNARPVATVATRTISEFGALRREMRANAKVPVGV